jgi:hypothetical protein
MLLLLAGASRLPLRSRTLAASKHSGNRLWPGQQAAGGPNSKHGPWAARPAAAAAATGRLLWLGAANAGRGLASGRCSSA